MAFVNLLEIIYPVGALYFSTRNTSPSSIVGGTWTQITSAALRGSTSTGYTGKDTTTLTLSQIPKHNHLAAGVIQTNITANTNGGDHIVAHYTNWNITDTNGSGFITDIGGGNPTQIFNVLTTAIFGIAPHKSKRVMVI